MHFRDIIANSFYQKDWVTMIMVQNKWVHVNPLTGQYFFWIVVTNSSVNYAVVT